MIRTTFCFTHNDWYEGSSHVKPGSQHQLLQVFTWLWCSGVTVSSLSQLWSNTHLTHHTPHCQPSWYWQYSQQADSRTAWSVPGHLQLLQCQWQPVQHHVQVMSLLLIPSLKYSNTLIILRFGLTNPYLSQTLAQAGAGGGGGKFPDLTVTQRAAMYWPGIQGLMSNPAVWRDRFVLNSKFYISY